MGVVSSKMIMSPIHWPRQLTKWFDECENDVNHMLLPLQSPYLNPVEHPRCSPEMKVFLSSTKILISNLVSSIGMIKKHDVPKRVHRRFETILHITLCYIYIRWFYILCRLIIKLSLHFDLSHTAGELWLMVLMPSQSQNLSADGQTVICTHGKVLRSLWWPVKMVFDVVRLHIMSSFTHVTGIKIIYVYVLFAPES